MANYFCARCGIDKVEVKGSACESCKEKHEANEEMWKRLRCNICGNKAIGFDIFGPFCNDHKRYRRGAKPPVYQDDKIIVVDI